LKNFLCVFLLVFIVLSAFTLPLSASPADTVIENLSAFNEQFSVSTDNIISVFREAFAAKPELIFYYYGMSYTVYGDHTDCEVQYTNTDIAISNIQIVNSSSELYECLRSAMMNAETKVYVVFTGGKELNTDFSDIIDQIHDRDYIAYMGYKSISVHSFINNHSDAIAYMIDFTYGYDSATMTEMKQETKAEVDWLASEVFSPGMSEYMLVKSIHDYLIDNTVYAQNSNENFIYYAYGPLVKGTGVCEGYAEAARLLFDAVGIESLFVSGTVDDSIPHAWNLVKIGGNWYQLDITWDDPITSDGRDVKTYEYFNITDAEMALDHVWSGNYPPCTATDRGIGATDTAVRPESQDESSEPSSVETSSVQASLPEPVSSSQTVSSKPSEPSASAASSETSSQKSVSPESSSLIVSSFESSSEPILPTFSVSSIPASSEPSAFEFSTLITSLSHQLGISIPFVTALLAVAAVAFLIIIVALIFRKRD